MDIEGQIRAVLAAGWWPPAGQVSTVDEMEMPPAWHVVLGCTQASPKIVSSTTNMNC